MNKSRKTHQNPIKRARPSTPLGVPKSCDPSVEAKTLREYFFDVFCTNRLEIRIVRTLGDDDDCLTLASCSVL